RRAEHGEQLLGDGGVALLGGREAGEVREGGEGRDGRGHGPALARAEVRPADGGEGGALGEVGVREAEDEGTGVLVDAGVVMLGWGRFFLFGGGGGFAAGVAVAVVS